MRVNLYAAVLALLLGALLSGCAPSSPARLCDSPLVPVNALVPAAHSRAASGSTEHE
jgi:hypothetical protein